MMICAALAAGQTVPVAASLLQDGNSLACATGSGQTGCMIYWTPVLSSGAATVYRQPGGGMATPSPLSTSVSNGAFNLPSVPDSLLTTPKYLCWRVVLVTPNGSSLLGSCVQPSASNYWFSGTVDNFDNWIPSFPPSQTIDYVQSINGCVGVCTVAGGSGESAVYPTFNGLAAYNPTTGAWIPPTNAMIVSILGFTPYNATNPAGYITASALTPYPLTSSLGSAAYEPTSYFQTALGFTPYNATNPSGYITPSALSPYALISSLGALATQSTLLHSQLPALQSGDIPNNTANSGQAATALAFAATPSGQCAGGTFATGIQANGNANCGTPSGSGNVSTYGTVTAGQFPVWYSSTQMQGVNAATFLSDIGAQAALGFTPYNSTNPAGYITVSALSPYLLSSGFTSAAIQSLLGGSVYDAYGAASTAQGASLQKSSNLSDLTNAGTARTNLGLGSAATQNTSAFDAAGTAAAAVAGSMPGNAGTATALAANGNNCATGLYSQGVDASGNAEGCATPPGTYSLPGQYKTWLASDGVV